MSRAPHASRPAARIAALALLGAACAPDGPRIERFELPPAIDDAARIAAIETPTRLDARLIRAGEALPSLSLDGERAEVHVVDLGASAEALALDPTVVQLSDDAAEPYRTLNGVRVVWTRGIGEAAWTERATPSLALQQLRLPVVPACKEVRVQQIHVDDQGLLSSVVLVDDFGRSYIELGLDRWLEFAEGRIEELAPPVAGLDVVEAMRSGDGAATMLAGRRGEFDEIWARRRDERDWRRIASVRSGTVAAARIRWLASVREDLNLTMSFDGRVTRFVGSEPTLLYRAEGLPSDIGGGAIAAPNDTRVFVLEPFDPSSDRERTIVEIAQDGRGAQRRISAFPKQLWTIAWVPALEDVFVGGATGPPVPLSRFVADPTAVNLSLAGIRALVPVTQGPWRGYGTVDTKGLVRLYWRGLDPSLSTTSVGRCELASFAQSGEQMIQQGYGVLASGRATDEPRTRVVYWLEPTTP
jgi:hypothetical protein